MSIQKFVKNEIYSALMNTHTSFLATVESVDGNKATIIPLTLVKAFGEQPKQQAVMPNVPFCKHVADDMQAGATVLVTCCERDITQAVNGVFALPAVRHHSLSDAIIIGVIET